LSRQQQLTPPRSGSAKDQPELVLKPNQLQDLNDIIPELLRVAAGHELALTVSVAVKGAQRPNDEVVQSVNALTQVDERLGVI
jgi:hypothetical protein